MVVPFSFDMSEYQLRMRELKQKTNADKFPRWRFKAKKGNL